ncbi:zinc-binding protein A33-like [Discoglossus pictus]
MAKALHSESGLTEELSCSICCDLLNEPVMLDCMHHFCKACIMRYWENAKKEPTCPQCRRVITNKFFRTNHLMQKVVDQVKKASSSGYYSKTQKYLNDMLMEREKQSLKLEQKKQEAEKRIIHTEEVGEEMCKLISEEFKRLRDILSKEEKAIISLVEKEQHESLSRLQLIVDKLNNQIAELSDDMLAIYEAKKKTGDSLLLETEAIKKRKAVCRETTTDLASPDLFTNKYRGPIQYMVWRRMFKSIHPAPAPLTFDTSSAHPSLMFSSDLRSVMESEQPSYLNSADMTHRFTQSINVLASQTFRSGRHYWEVWVGNKTKWDVGVASSNVNRKVRVKLTPANGYWAIRLREYDQYWAATFPWTPLEVDNPMQKIGVYLDCGEEQVSFYNAEDMTHLYTFTGINADSFCPFFSTCFRDGLENSEPMRICHLTI